MVSDKTKLLHPCPQPIFPRAVTRQVSNHETKKTKVSVWYHETGDEKYQSQSRDFNTKKSQSRQVNFGDAHQSF
jgi:hypothetical protein